MDGEKRVEATSDALQVEIDQLGMLYEMSNRNPVFAWKVLAIQAFARARSRVLGRSSPELVIPDWVADYMTEAAAKMVALAEGIEPICESLPSQSNTTRFSIVMQRRDPPAAIARIPSILGLVSRGKNQFKEFQAVLEDQHNALEMERARRGGHTYANALSSPRGERRLRPIRGPEERHTRETNAGTVASSPARETPTTPARQDLVPWLRHGKTYPPSFAGAKPTPQPSPLYGPTALVIFPRTTHGDGVTTMSDRRYNLLTEEAERLKVCPRTIQRYCKDQGFPYIRLGHRLRFDPELSDQWLSARVRLGRAAELAQAGA